MFGRGCASFVLFLEAVPASDFLDCGLRAAGNGQFPEPKEIGSAFCHNKKAVFWF
jgi:hypothetical protein